MRLIATLCAILAVTLFAVACGGSDDRKDGGILSGNQTSSTSSSTSSSQAAPDTGKPATTSGNAKLLDPCALFSKDDAAAALGQPVKDGVFKDAGAPLGQRLCFYAAVDDKTASSVQLSVIQTAGLAEALRNNGQTAKVQYEQQKALAGAGTGTDLPGVGQGAFIRGTNVYSYKGDTEFSVLLMGNGKPGDASHTNALKAAATKVVGKLP